VWFDLKALGLSEDVPHAEQPVFEAHDLLTGETYEWARQAFVRLDPIFNCAHIIQVRPL
jgi:starch synthase (maltosyl-transferring)